MIIYHMKFKHIYISGQPSPSPSELPLIAAVTIGLPVVKPWRFPHGPREARLALGLPRSDPQHWGVGVDVPARRGAASPQGAAGLGEGHPVTCRCSSDPSKAICLALCGAGLCFSLTPAL